MRNRRRVIFFFTSLIGTTWVMNRMLTLERKHNSATMSSVEIDNLVENVVNERFGSISQGTELNFIDFHCNINRTKLYKHCINCVRRTNKKYFPILPT